MMALSAFFSGKLHGKPRTATMPGMKEVNLVSLQTDGICCVNAAVWQMDF
jgi:hypothetical protein